MFDLYLSLFSKLSVWVIVTLSGICVVLGDYYGKLWSEDLLKANFIFSILFYSLSSIIFMPALLKQSLTMTSVVWSLISILGFLVIGLIIFKETLTNTQIIAVVFGVVSLILFSLSE